MENVKTLRGGPESARLLTTFERRPRTHEISGDTVLGRSKEADVHIPYPGVSRLHARIILGPDGHYVLEDLGSRNGTFVNSARVTRHQLSFGEEIRLGEQATLLFTRSIEIEERLAEEQKMEAVGRLAAGVAHEFNNFLAIIVSSIEYLNSLVGEVLPARPDVVECIEDASSAANQASLVTRQLLSFARPARSAVEDVDLTSLLREVAQLIRRTFDRNISILLDAPPGLYVVGERALLFQAFMNLCLNARDAMNEGGRLSIRARVERTEGIIVEIEDTGAGVPPEAIEHVFEPFYTTKAGRGGTGLGLAIVYGIIRSHGGDIEVTSTVNVGTSFRIRLRDATPTRTETFMMTEERTETFAIEHPRPMRVLIVDDEPLVRNSVGRILRFAGHDVMTASNGAEAVEIYKKHGTQISAVLLDLNMPVMGGAETLKQLKELNPYVPVVVLSGYAQEEREELLQRGALAVLDKPTTAQQLKEALRTAVF